VDIDFSGEDMMPISWEKCPACRWSHNPERRCPPVPSPDEEEEDKMRSDTDWADAANSALAAMERPRKSKKTKKAKKTKVEGQVNPVNVETRFGVLPPWGGAMGGGASIRFREDDTEKN
jgi:hypothetical protein